MDPEVTAYVAAIAPEHRPLFDRIERLIREACPDATASISYKLPTFTVGKRRLHVGVWSHGVSLYGWGRDRDAGFSLRHPELLSGRATLRLRSDDAAAIGDDELLDFARASLAP